MAVAALALTACGSSTTTVVNNTTTVTVDSTESVSDNGASTGLTVSADGDFTGAELGDEYTGRCGDRGVVTGGVVGTSTDEVRPGFKDLRVKAVGCPVAASAAQSFVDAWEPSCEDGCNVNVGGFLCEYDGGSYDGAQRTGVYCYSAQDQVWFDLAFLVD